MESKVEEDKVAQAGIAEYYRMKSGHNNRWHNRHPGDR